MNERYKNYAYVILGGVIFGLTVNVFVMPLGLYNGGFTGIAQILRDLIVNTLNFNPKFEMTGIIMFLLNVPIFVFAYKRMSRRFVVNSLLTIIAQTVTMSFVPIPKEPFSQDMIIGILLAAVIGAYGVSRAFKGRGSAGGLDVIGIYFSQNKKGSVGQIYHVVNAFIYLYCFIFYDLEIAAYLLLYSTYKL